MIEKESILKGKGLEIGSSSDETVLRGSLAARSIMASGDAFTGPGLKGKGLAIANKVEPDQVGETFDDSRVQYNHPEIFDQLEITPVESSEDSERVTYEIPDVGVLSLLKIDDYDGKRVLQVDIAEINDDKKGQGFGTDMYRYVANHLPPSYQGILSGTITHEAIRHIYETLSKDSGFLLHKIGNGVRPSLIPTRGD